MSVARFVCGIVIFSSVGFINPLILPWASLSFPSEPSVVCSFMLKSRKTVLSFFFFFFSFTTQSFPFSSFVFYYCRLGEVLCIFSLLRNNQGFPLLYSMLMSYQHCLVVICPLAHVYLSFLLYFSFSLLSFPSEPNIRGLLFVQSFARCLSMIRQFSW